ncbi:hypothetical protein [Rhizobium sullae]|uniref:hypothetical protein n=1 Tax=Rhizobium sullae TaxID=50338 RepID=UPI0015C67A2C|nr:hypothetical protein [Rhizobium sullae]
MAAAMTEDVFSFSDIAGIFSSLAACLLPSDVVVCHRTSACEFGYCILQDLIDATA